MSAHKRTQVLDARVEFIARRLAVPLVLSSGTIEKVTEARAAVTVRVGSQAGTRGVEATGRGSIYLSDLWAWPDLSLSHDERDRELRGWCDTIARRLSELCGGEAAHPLELGLRLHHRVCEDDSIGPASTSPAIPALARAMCVSPFDAALHDAAGLALARSAFSFYDEPAEIPTVDGLFAASGGASAAIRRMLRSSPQRAFPACVVVGQCDDAKTHLAEWVRQCGYRRVKLKLGGHDNAADAARTVEVFRALRDCGVAAPWISVDTNEANPDSASVLDYLHRLQAADAAAFAALQYLEQPTGRDILRHAFDWRPVTRLKPVLLDEGLTSFAALDAAREQGWSGFALKMCKGHSFALVAAAWAREHGLACALQDLTNPGYSALHAALFAAFVPTINGVELNSPQFTPAANAEWLPRLAGLLEPRDGVHRLAHEIPPGLGSSW